MATRTKAKSAAPTKIDLACGKNKREGFYGVDLWAPEADMRMDVLEYPWPWADGSVDEFHASHFVEHIPMGGVDDGLVAFAVAEPGAAETEVGFAWTEGLAEATAASELLATLDLDADGRAELVWIEADRVEIRGLGESTPRPF